MATTWTILVGCCRLTRPMASRAAVEWPVEDAAAGLAAFRWKFYRCLTRRADALFEPVDAALYAQAPQAVAWYAAVPQPLIVFIGVCEVLGGVGLILPAITRVKPKPAPLAAAPALTMVLAAGFHVVRGEYELVPCQAGIRPGSHTLHCSGTYAIADGRDRASSRDVNSDLPFTRSSCLRKRAPADFLAL